MTTRPRRQRRIPEQPPFPVNIPFHRIGTPRRDLEPGEASYWVGVEQFEALLDEVTVWPHARLSFDDSNSSDVEIALPALIERGLTADFFVLAGRLGKPGSLGEDDLHALIKNGMTVGSHGMEHHPWRKLDTATINRELVVARDMLASVLGRPVTMAGCPLGRYDRTTLTALRRLGYSQVFTSDRRPARPGRWLQPRFSVYSDSTPESVRAAVLRSAEAVSRMRATAVGVVKRWR
jgi:peptidoglycan/xylan/chitin deacetylase (PgdA/CDA1 family)